MRQVLHVFKKDVRRLWLEISIALAAAVAFTFTVARGAQSVTDPETTKGVASALLTNLLPLVWCALIARLVYSEPLPGDRQFWVTRPYAWKSLLAAKALFIAVFVNLPKLIGDATILHVYGFEIWPELGGLVWTQVLLTSVFVLPVLALSAVTTGFAQLIVVAFLLVLTFVGWYSVTADFGAGDHWFALEWTRSYFTGLVVAIAAVAIILRQYGRKDTAASRFLAGAALLLAFLSQIWLPWPVAFALQSRLSMQSIDTSAMRVVFDPDMKWTARALVNKDNSVDLEIPLRVTGIPAALRPRVDGIGARIEGTAGAVWRADKYPGRHVRPEGVFSWLGEFTWFRAHVDSSFYRKVKDHPVRISGSLYLTLYGNPRRTVLRIEDQAILAPTAGVGLCSATRTRRGIVLNCRSAFRARPDLAVFDILKLGRGDLPVSFHALSFSRPISYSPFAAESNLIPVTQSVQYAEIFGPVSGVSVYAVEPVTHIRTDFEITSLRLTDYETGHTAATKP